MTDAREAFLAGGRPDDVALFLADSYVSDDRLERFGERVEGGTLLIVDGERGRNAFRAATGTGAMEFAGTAMRTEGVVDGNLAGGTCPDAPEGEIASDVDDAETGMDDAATDEDDADADEGDADADDTEADHEPRFVLAFAEEQNEEVGGRYGEGDVIHAYAQCSCGTAYSDRWTVEG